MRTYTTWQNETIYFDERELMTKNQLIQETIRIIIGAAIALAALFGINGLGGDDAKPTDNATAPTVTTK